MLSTAADAAQLAQAAPWLAVGLLALAAAAWVFRQGRRSLASLESRLTASANRQGKRLGELENRCGLLDLRRRQVEWVLLERGLELPYWPPDGREQPRHDAGRHGENFDQADNLTREAPRPPVPARSVSS